MKIYPTSQLDLTIGDLTVRRWRVSSEQMRALVRALDDLAAAFSIAEGRPIGDGEIVDALTALVMHEAQSQMEA